MPGAVVVAAAYADARRVPHAPLAPELLPRVARAAGVGVCLLDTAVKDGRGLLEWLSPDALASLVDEAHAAGLQVALAGALRAEDLPVVRDTGADIAGVRSAACRDGRRCGTARRGARPCPGRGYAAAGDSMSSRRGGGGRPSARFSPHGRGDGVAPDFGRLLGPRQEVLEELWRGLRLDQAAQAEADVPALVELDAPMPSRTPGSAPSARSSRSVCCPASKTTPSSSMW